MPDPRTSLPLATIIAELRLEHGPIAAASVTDPFQQVLLEQVAYLASDENTKIGLEPESVRAAPDELRLEVASVGGAIALARIGGDGLRAQGW